ncbi:histidine phosphatase family protein [Reichenbachiella sp. MALMAid0571]|uniref:SixA phosphatase family protein n=1 Tax=Reichenbachiella sp. MALMAid0571 TaxID=3143939 RepID=UPI0032E04CD2
MKELYIVRHAKSSWDFPHLTDHERPLNERGKSTAPLMAEYVKKRIVSPNVFISSDAVRAYSTAFEFVNVFGVSQKEIIKEKKLYHASKRDWFKIIREIDDQFDSAMLFGHNPGLTDFVNEIAGGDIYNIPTCGVAGIHLEIISWKDVGAEMGKLEHYYFPKGIKGK